MVSSRKRKNRSTTVSPSAVRDSNRASLSRSPGRTPNLYQPLDAIIVGIDPSSVAHGYSVFDRGIYCYSGKIKANSAFNIHKVVQDIWTIWAYTRSTKKTPVVFISEDWGGSVTALKVLCEERGRWKQAIEVCTADRTGVNAHWALVNTQTWTRAFGISGRTKERKKMAIALAENIKKSSCKDDNEADAILIGAFGCRWPKLQEDFSLKTVRVTNEIR